MSGGDMDVMPISDGDQFTRFESGMLAPLDDFIAKRRRRYGQVFWKICNLGTV